MVPRSLSEVHRTTFARQAANLWKVKEHLLAGALGRRSLRPNLRHLRLFALAGLSVRTRLQMQTLPWGGGFRQGHTAEADLLGLQGACQDVLAWGDHPLFGGPSQRPRASLSVVPELLERTQGV